MALINTLKRKYTSQKNMSHRKDPSNKLTLYIPKARHTLAHICCQGCFKMMSVLQKILADFGENSIIFMGAVFT